MTVLETAMLSSEREHSSDLDLQCLSSPPSLHIFSLFKSVMDDWLQLLHQITTQRCVIQWREGELQPTQRQEGARDPELSLPPLLSPHPSG